MTPLIHKWARILPYPGDGAHWFDLGTLSGQVEEFDWSDDRIARLPFPRTMVVASDQRGDECALLVLCATASVTVAGDFLHSGEHKQVGPFTYFQTTEGLRLHRIEGIPRESVHFCLALIHMLVTRLDERAVESYASEPDRGLTSTRRMANGKPPLRYSWRTVTVRPAAPNVAVATSDVAHHASPRAHSRRGHWRNLRTGKRVWVRDCRVGNPALGEVMHDYRVLARG